MNLKYHPNSGIRSLFIGLSIAGLLIPSTVQENCHAEGKKDTNKNSVSSANLASKSCGAAQNSGIVKNEKTLLKIEKRAKAERWENLPIGEVIGKVAKELEGTPYVANTLDESADEEVPLVDMNALDCVTFFETSMDLARAIKKKHVSKTALLNEIRYTRYRDGNVGDYTTRLHYTTDWLVDNEAKHVVQILADLPGAEPFKQKVDFMTTHPSSYKQLAAHPEFIEKLKSFEANINKRSLKFIPVEKVSAIEPLLKTGDIIGLCTNIKGLDITHTGIIYRDIDGKPHFMDASSRKSTMKVVIEPLPIGEMLTQNQKRSATLTGIMVARPLEP